MPGRMPISVAAGATTEPAPSENPDPNAYEADQIRAFGAKASWRSSNAMPPATPGCSASYSPSTRFQMHHETRDQHSRSGDQHRELGRDHARARSSTSYREDRARTRTAATAPERRQHQYRDDHCPAS